MSLKQIALVGAVLFAAACGGNSKAKPAAPESKPPITAEEKPGVPMVKAALVDINTATQDQLESLPGIGREHCHHIMMARPYTEKSELVTRSVIPQENYDKIKDLVVASAPKP